MWMCAVTKKDKIRNEHHVRGSVKVAPVTKNTREKAKWYGHVMRRVKWHVTQ